jgi:uncharacterized protein
MVRALMLVAICALAAACATAPASPERHAGYAPIDYLPAITGGYFPIRSREAEHDYHIYVRLPEGYADNPERRYPVVYLLDGDSLFPIIGGGHIFLTIDDKLPEAIVVGIAYGSFAKPINRRHIDFMPPGPGVKAAESRVADFHRFLERELLPAVEGRYRIDPARRILFGQSRAGGLILYSAFTHPDIFWARIASNPSWTPGREIFYAAPAPATRRDLRLVIAVGTGEYADRRAAAGEWFAHWQGRTAPWTIAKLDIPGGTHSADAANAYRAAMRSIFIESAVPASSR